MAEEKLKARLNKVEAKTALERNRNNMLAEDALSQYSRLVHNLKEQDENQGSAIENGQLRRKVTNLEGKNGELVDRISQLEQELDTLYETDQITSEIVEKVIQTEE